MNIYGIGTDIVNVNEFKLHLKKIDKLLKKEFTQNQK